VTSILYESLNNVNLLLSLKYSNSGDKMGIKTNGSTLLSRLGFTV